MAGNYSTKARFGQEKRRGAPEQGNHTNPAGQRGELPGPHGAAASIVRPP